MKRLSGRIHRGMEAFFNLIAPRPHEDSADSWTHIMWATLDRRWAPYRFAADGRILGRYSVWHHLGVVLRRIWRRLRGLPRLTRLGGERN
jgi:hypothetical protein